MNINFSFFEQFLNYLLILLGLQVSNMHDHLFITFPTLFDMSKNYIFKKYKYVYIIRLYWIKNYYKIVLYIFSKLK
jgi:hypothetical protein